MAAHPFELASPQTAQFMPPPPLEKNRCQNIRASLTFLWTPKSERIFSNKWEERQIEHFHLMLSKKIFFFLCSFYWTYFSIHQRTYVVCVYLCTCFFFLKLTNEPNELRSFAPRMKHQKEEERDRYLSFPYKIRLIIFLVSLTNNVCNCNELYWLHRVIVFFALLIQISFSSFFHWSNIKAHFFPRKVAAATATISSSSS